MRIALFSDIHANLPALEAVFKDMDAKSPDMVFCLGDLVGYCTWPSEVIREIRNRRIPVIAGNYDQGVGLNSDDCGCAYKTDHDKALGVRSISYTNKVISESDRAYLHGLPAHMRIDVRFADNSVHQLLFVHGSPRKINEYLFEERDERSLSRIMHDEGAEVMAYGHTHKPYHKHMTGEGEHLHAVNIGSVGKPKDGDVRACYAMLDLSDVIKNSSFEHLKVEFIRVEYDVEKAATSIESSELPNEFADMLRKAY